jgi:hypothetical protein
MNWKSELEQVCDSVSLERLDSVNVLHGWRWENAASLEVIVWFDPPRALVTVHRAGEATQYEVNPLEQIRVRQSTSPMRIDLDKPYGGRLTVWTDPLSIAIGGAL